MSDLVSKRDAIKAVHSYWKKRIDETPTVKKSGVDVYSQEAIDMLLHSKNLSTLINTLPTIGERKKGEWNEQKVFDTEDSDIAQMQSAKCSVCGKYHTTPYLYFFDSFNFCPNCGADMRGDNDE